MHVLLLHGLPADGSDWHRVAALLAAAGVTPLAPDRPGWGPDELEGRGIDGNVEAALAALDAAGAAQAVVAGHSWGSVVALALAERFPERVAAVALVSPFGPGSVGPRARLFAAPLVGDALVRVQLWVSGLAQAVPPLRGWIARRFGYEEDALAARGRRWLGAREWRAFVLEQRAVVHGLDALLERAPALRMPTLVLVGSHDRATGTEPACALAWSIPRARLRVVPHVGHYLPLTHPDETAEELLRLVEATRPGSSSAIVA